MKAIQSLRSVSLRPSAEWDRIVLVVATGGDDVEVAFVLESVKAERHAVSYRLARGAPFIAAPS